jgi:hypothetical protein
MNLILVHQSMSLLSIGTATTPQKGTISYIRSITLLMPSALTPSFALRHHYNVSSLDLQYHHLVFCTTMSAQFLGPPTDLSIDIRRTRLSRLRCQRRKGKTNSGIHESRCIRVLAMPHRPHVQSLASPHIRQWSVSTVQSELFDKLEEENYHRAIKVRSVLKYDYGL